MEDLKNIKKLLLALALKTKGNWEQMYLMIRAQEYPSQEEIENAEKSIKCHYITYLDKEYPENLKRVHRAPFVLFYYGDISLLNQEKQSIAVIGSRDATDLGVDMTMNFVSDLCRDYVIVSGLARGIDSAAHISAIQNRGKTVAVLGSGIDYCYPQENWDLYKIIKKKGLVVSEYPNDTMPEPDKFPMRNRIIAGLAKGILIMEAKRKSGTLITVNFAQSFAKEVMCVPYRISDDSGCNQLIKEGAYMVEDTDDVRIVMNGTRDL